MNLDKLKELEHRLSHSQLTDIGHDCANRKLFFVYEDDRKVYLTHFDIDDTCELRNSAKEMIETIERYRETLELMEVLLATKSMTEEEIRTGYDQCDLALYPEKALKDPEAKA